MIYIETWFDQIAPLFLAHNVGIFSAFYIYDSARKRYDVEAGTVWFFSAVIYILVIIAHIIGMVIFYEYDSSTHSYTNRPMAIGLILLVYFILFGFLWKFISKKPILPKEVKNVSLLQKIFAYIILFPCLLVLLGFLFLFLVMSHMM